MKRRLLYCMVACILLFINGCFGDTPGTWEESVINNNIKIDINAEISGDSSGNLKEFMVKTNDFTDEKCKEIIRCVFDDGLADDIQIPSEGIMTCTTRKIQYRLYYNFAYLYDGGDGVIQLEDWILPGDAYPGEPRGTRITNIKISKKDAKSICEEILKELNVDYMSVANVSKARIILPSYEVVSEGWYISYARQYNGYKNMDITEVMPEHRMGRTQTSQMAPWMPEMIFMYVDETGIRMFQWNDPIEIVGAKQVVGVSFEKIKKNIIEHFGKHYFWDITIGHEDRIPQIKGIKIIGTLLSDGTNHNDCGKIVPTWVVYYTTKEDQECFSDISVVCFSAIDGKYVNPFIMWEQVIE